MMRPLRKVLNQLCPGSDATSFWMSFTTVMLYVTPLLVTVLFLATVTQRTAYALVLAR
jgi:hypothetical protein